MMITAQARLQFRNQQLQSVLLNGTDVQIIAARELFRVSLVELHELGYWREYPDQFNAQMRLYRACATLRATPLGSMSAPDRKARCIL
jgi:hypothetical protein